MMASATRGLARLLPHRSDYAELPRSWRRDVIAGATVGVVALPLALAFGISSGVGAAAGLITAVVAGLVAAVFGGSNVQVSGPTGAMAVVLAPIVSQHGLGSIALVTVLAGVITIFLQQVPSALGSVAPQGRNSPSAAWYVVRHVDLASAGTTLAVAALVAALMIGLPRLHRAIPESLAAVLAATVLVVLAHVPVARIGELPSHPPSPVLPAADLGASKALFGAALAIAALAGIESLLSARVAATMAPTGPYDPNRELVGQG